MLVEIFIEGICLACKTYQMSTIETRISGLERSIGDLENGLERLDSELMEMKMAIDKLANFRIAELRNESMKLLGQVGKATSINADILSTFIASIGSHISAITFRGRRRQREDSSRFGIQVYRGFIANTQTPGRMFQTLGKLQDLSEITGGRIETGCVMTKNNMKAVAIAIGSFFKIAQLFNVKVNHCVLTDKLTNSNDKGVEICIRFEGRYMMSNYQQLVSDKKTNHVEIIRNSRKNVYILGPNGVGKSTWGNIISNKNTFEVGISNHTTMIPQSFDFEEKDISNNDFRLWDTPGLFDGSEEQGLMEDYMNKLIDINGYFSGVVFLFSGTYPANEATGKILQYAVDRFGERIKKNFIVIINDFYGTGEQYRPTYSEIMYRQGFIDDGTNVFICNAKSDPNKVRYKLQSIINSFDPRLVAKHSEVYKSFMNASHGDLRLAVRRLYMHGKKELESIISRGKIETVRYNDSGPSDFFFLGPRRNTSIGKDIIIFRQHSKGVIRRALGMGTDHVLAERSIQLKGPRSFILTIRAQLNQEYTMGEVNIFLRHILHNERYILIHTPKSDYDYELRDASQMSDKQLQELVMNTLVNEINSN